MLFDDNILISIIYLYIYILHSLFRRYNIPETILVITAGLNNITLFKVL